MCIYIYLRTSLRVETRILFTYFPFRCECVCGNTNNFVRSFFIFIRDASHSIVSSPVNLRPIVLFIASLTSLHGTTLVKRNVTGGLSEANRRPCVRPLAYGRGSVAHYMADVFERRGIDSHTVYGHL